MSRGPIRRGVSASKRRPAHQDAGPGGSGHGQGPGGDDHHRRCTPLHKGMCSLGAECKVFTVHRTTQKCPTIVRPQFLHQNAKAHTPSRLMLYTPWFAAARTSTCCLLRQPYLSHPPRAIRRRLAIRLSQAAPARGEHNLPPPKSQHAPLEVPTAREGSVHDGSQRKHDRPVRFRFRSTCRLDHRRSALEPRHHPPSHDIILPLLVALLVVESSGPVIEPSLPLPLPLPLPLRNASWGGEATLAVHHDV